eukprot:GFYU01015354.1.p1 GENE.GFYU01015354.1~~GFYU01015354.1.p1  ORF type:complete len:109 (+),score=22.79 GFYU01015354.1:167-493(+)
MVTTALTVLIFAQAFFRDLIAPYLNSIPVVREILSSPWSTAGIIIMHQVAGRFNSTGAYEITITKDGVSKMIWSKLSNKDFPKLEHLVKAIMDEWEKDKLDDASSDEE